jgi:hypothetical protein
MGKKVRLMAGAAGMAPALGLAVATPAAAAQAAPAAAPAAHASGKTVSLQAARATGATACTGTFSKVATAGAPHLGLSVSYKGSCVLGAIGRLHFNESPGSLSGDVMRTRVYDDGARVFSSRGRFADSSGSVRVSQRVGVIGHKVCATAFSRLHPTEKIAGPVCVKI